MKKSKLLLAGLSMLMAFGLAGCGGETDPSTGDATPQDYIFASGGTTGTYYPYSAAVSQLWANNIEGFNAGVQATGGSSQNLQLLSTGDADIAIVQNDVMQYAYDGTQSFEGKALQGYSVLGTVYYEVCQIVAPEKAGITTVADLAGKKVSVGDIGSGVYSNAEQILGAYGISFDDIKSQSLGFGDSANQIKDGTIDAAFVTAGAPTPAIMELSSTNDVTIVPVTGAEAEALIAEYPFYASYTLPEGTYAGIEGDVETLAVKATIIVSDNLPEETVYQMTKTLFENQESLESAHAKGAELDLEKAIEGVGIPFHTGATKYYTEAGIMK